MTLYSMPFCVLGHSCRIVALEKEVECEILFVESEAEHHELAQISPYGESPALLDRDLVLYSAQIINEYLDERLPHPPLLPVDPMNRGRARLASYRIQRDWLSNIDQEKNRIAKLSTTNQRILRDGLVAMSPIFKERSWLLGEEFSLADCALAPLLWRLPSLGVKLPHQAKPLVDYADRLFQRPSFTQSLSKQERELR